MKLEGFFEAVKDEKERQIKKHQLTRWHDLENEVDWLACLSEEFGEVAKQVMRLRFKQYDSEAQEEYEKRHLTEELIQLATVAGAWVCDEE